MSDGPNAGEEACWNSGLGQRWVEHAADLDTVHAGVTELILREAAPQPGESVLDVGCGAGATTLALAQAVTPEGHVLGVDISAPLLELAETRRRSAGVANATFERCDAQTRPFEKGSLDLVASRFGVMFFADPVAAFANLARALRPGGRMVLAAWADADRNPWFGLARRIAEERLGSVPAAPPNVPGPMAFRDIERVVGLLRAAGLSDCAGMEVPVELHHPGGLAAVRSLAGRLGPTACLMREKEGTEEDLIAITDRIAEAFSGYVSADGIRIPAAVNLFLARRA